MKGFKKIINMKRWSVVIIAILIYLLAVSQSFATVVWDHWSPLNVVETITDLNNGLYRYGYSFVNVDTSPIWHFRVCTTFVTQGHTGGTKFTGHSSWGGPGWASITSVYSEYDARNLDPYITGITGPWTIPWVDSATAIQVDEAASGFSFLASTYNSSPKYYLYETIMSGYTQTNGTREVAAVGLTAVPEPATVALLGLSSLALFRKHKKQRFSD